MSAPTGLKNLYAVSNSNGTAAQTIFTHGPGLKNPDGTLGYGGILDRMSIFNGDTVQHVVRIYRVPSAGAAGAANLIEKITLPADTPYLIEGPYWSTDSAFYQVKLDEAHTTAPVSCQAWYHEMT